MAEGPREDIRMTPRGRWEKIGSWLMVFPGVPVLPLTDVLADLGLALWERLGVALLVFGTGAYFLLGRVRRDQRARQVEDAERGVFECGIRFPTARPGSLSDIWEFGAGRLRHRTFQFQTQMGDLDATPGGRLKLFPDASMTDEPGSNVPGKLPVAQRRWRSVFLSTEGGLLQVAVPPAGLAVFERELRAAGHSAAENRD